MAGTTIDGRMKFNEERIRALLDTRKIDAEGKLTDDYLFDGANHPFADRQRILTSLATNHYEAQGMVFIKQQIETYCLPIIEEQERRAQAISEQ